MGSFLNIETITFRRLGIIYFEYCYEMSMQLKLDRNNIRFSIINPSELLSYILKINNNNEFTILFEINTIKTQTFPEE